MTHSNMYMSIGFGRFIVDVWPVAIGVLVVLLAIRRRKNHSLSHLFCCTVFGIYVLFALD